MTGSKRWPALRASKRFGMLRRSETPERSKRQATVPRRLRGAESGKSTRQAATRPSRPRPIFSPSILSLKILRAAQIFVEPMEARAGERRPSRNQGRPQRVGNRSRMRRIPGNVDDAGCRRERQPARRSVMMLSRTLQDLTTQMAIHAATAIDAANRGIGPGHRILHGPARVRARAAHENTKPTSTNPVDLAGCWARWVLHPPPPEPGTGARR